MAEPRPVRYGMAATTVWKCAVTSVVLFSLLASGSLVRAARGQEQGWRRDASVAAAGAVDRVANFLSLNRPLDWANAALGREDVEPDIEFPPVTLPPAGASTTLPPRVASAASPLRVGVYGDSLSIDLGRSIASRFATNPLVDVVERGKVSTGLARPDSYNWPARLQELLAGADKDVIVFLAGSNDDQTLQDRDGTVVASAGSASWAEEYRRRVKGLMDLVNNGEHRLVWVGVPLVGRPELQRVTSLINDIVEDEASSRPWVTFVDTEAPLAGPDGRYTDYLQRDGRPPVRCRQGDSVHLTVDCFSIVADLVARQITEAFPSIASPAPTSPTTTGPSGSN